MVPAELNVNVVALAKGALRLRAAPATASRSEWNWNDLGNFMGLLTRGVDSGIFLSVGCFLNGERQQRDLRHPAAHVKKFHR